MADDRVIAVCEGGPLDGVLLSVPLDSKGQPEPLTSRKDVCGVLYVPAGLTPLLDEHTHERFTNPDGKEVAVPRFNTVVHDAAYRYIPQ